MSMDYVREKLWQAVHSLATGDENIQKRLEGASLFLIRLQGEDFPEELRPDFEAVMHGLTNTPAVANEGTIRATTSKLTPDEGSKLAERILSLYSRTQRED